MPIWVSFYSKRSSWKNSSAMWSPHKIRHSSFVPPMVTSCHPRGFGPIVQCTCGCLGEITWSYPILHLPLVANKTSKDYLGHCDSTSSSNNCVCSKGREYWYAWLKVTPMLYTYCIHVWDPFHSMLVNSVFGIFTLQAINSLPVFLRFEFALQTLVRRERAHCSEMKRLGQFSDGWKPMTNPSCFGRWRPPAFMSRSQKFQTFEIGDLGCDTVIPNLILRLEQR